MAYCSSQGLSESKIETLIIAAKKIMPGNEFQTCGELLRKQEQQFNIQTGCESVDELLGGGIREGIITQFW